MSQFKVLGFVPQFNISSNEFRIRVDNGKELEEFFKNEKIDTMLTYSEGKPLISIRGKQAILCKPGDNVCLTIELYIRKDGRRIKAVDVKVL